MYVSDRRRIFPELRHAAEHQDLVAGLVVLALLVGGGLAVGRWAGNPIADLNDNLAAAVTPSGPADALDGGIDNAGRDAAGATAGRAAEGTELAAAAKPRPEASVGDFGAPARGSAGPTATVAVDNYADPGLATTTSASGFRFGTSADTTDTTVASPAAQALALELQRMNDEQFPLFASDSTTLVGDARPVLNRLVDLLESHPTVRIEIAGHTDSFGAATGNLKLSQSRAKVVREYLVEAGIDESRVTAVGYGETEPRASNDTAPGRAKNRRIEFRAIG